jgi:hypothetical protein
MKALIAGCQLSKWQQQLQQLQKSHVNTGNRSTTRCCGSNNSSNAGEATQEIPWKAWMVLDIMSSVKTSVEGPGQD